VDQIDKARFCCVEESQEVAIRINEDKKKPQAEQAENDWSRVARP